MNNKHFNNNLTAYKNAILNFISEDNPHFLFNFLNRNDTINDMFVGSRKYWNGAHFRVTYYEPSLTNPNWKDFKETKAYYITFNTLDNNKPRHYGIRSFSLRKDLIDFWMKNYKSDNYVMVVDTKYNNIYSINVKTLLGSSKCLINDEVKYKDYVFALTPELIDKCSSINMNTYSGEYDVQYFKPECIANFVYSEYQQHKNSPCVLHTYNKRGEHRRSLPFRSASEALNFINKNVEKYDKSPSSFKRDIASEKLIEVTEGYYYLTRDMDAEPQTIREVKEEYGPNPLFNEDEEEDPNTNPRNIVIRAIVVIHKLNTEENTNGREIHIKGNIKEASRVERRRNILSA